LQLRIEYNVSLVCSNKTTVKMKHPFVMQSIFIFTSMTAYNYGH